MMKRTIKIALPYAATGIACCVLAPDAFAAGGNPIVTFLNTAVTQATLCGFGVAALGLMGVGGGMATGNHSFVGPGLKAGAGGAGIAGSSQLVGLFIPNGGGASLDLTSGLSAVDWFHLLVSAFS